MTRRTRALWAIGVTVLLWGFSFVSIKVAIQVFPPMSLGALRFAMASVLLLVVKRALAPRERLELRDVPGLAAAGLVGVTAYFFFENNGVLRVSASEASIVIGAIPVLSMIAERIAGGAGLAPRRWLGASLSVLGVWDVAGASVAVTGSVSGYLYMLGAAVSWVAYCFFTKPLFARRSRIFIVFWQTVFGFLGFVPFAIAELPRWGVPTAATFAHVAFLGIFCSALGYWLYAISLEDLGVPVSTVFVNLIPVVTVAAGFLFLGERLAPIQWAGAAAVIGGVYLATYEGKRRKNRTARKSDGSDALVAEG